MIIILGVLAAVAIPKCGLAGYGYHARDEYIELDSSVPRLYLMTRLRRSSAGSESP